MYPGAVHRRDMFTEVLSMRLIKLAIFVLALTGLTTSIGSMLFGWRLSSLNSSLCMLLLGPVEALRENER